MRAQRRGAAPARCARRVRRRRDEAVQDDDANVRAGVARGERLPVRPDAEHRVVARG